MLGASSRPRRVPSVNVPGVTQGLSFGVGAANEKPRPAGWRSQGGANLESARWGKRAPWAKSYHRICRGQSPENYRTINDRRHHQTSGCAGHGHGWPQTARRGGAGGATIGRDVADRQRLAAVFGDGHGRRVGLIWAGRQERRRIGGAALRSTGRWRPVGVGEQKADRQPCQSVPILYPNLISWVVARHRFAKCLILRDFFGERGGTRTLDPMIKSHVLYRLSYALTCRAV